MNWVTLRLHTSVANQDQEAALPMRLVAISVHWGSERRCRPGHQASSQRVVDLAAPISPRVSWSDTALVLDSADDHEALHTCSLLSIVMYVRNALLLGRSGSCGATLGVPGWAFVGESGYCQGLRLGRGCGRVARALLGPV